MFYVLNGGKSVINDGRIIRKIKTKRTVIEKW